MQGALFKLASIVFLLACLGMKFGVFIIVAMLGLIAKEDNYNGMASTRDARKIHALLYDK